MDNNRIVPMHQIGFPINVEIIIPEDDSVRLLYEVTEGLNYSKLYKNYSTIGRNSVIAPKTLFRILVYGYMEGIYSSRKLEKACKRDINFRWLLQGQKAPEHNTIARFRSERLSNCIEDLFNQLILKLGEIDEIQYKNIFIDGTKIEANANRYTFVWKKATNKFEEKLQIKMRKLLENLNSDFTFSIKIPENKIEVELLKEAAIKLNKLKEENNLEFVHGKGKHKSKLQKYSEVLVECIEKQSKYNKYNSIFNGRNSFSKTDNDATFMHLKEDHMKNGQLKPAYNVQIGVEAEYIVGVDISSERSDQLTFIPFLDRLDKNLSKRYESVTADAGYESEENYVYLEEHNQKAYIKPQTYEKSKKKKFKTDISKRENMNYDEEGDFFICAYGRRLVHSGSMIRKSKSNYQSEITKYKCLDCNGCPYRCKCNKGKSNKQLYVAKKFIIKRQESLENITTPEGILLRMNRSIQVEGAFGVIKQDLGYRRFLMRGNKNVRTEILLLAFGYNINKLYNKRQQNRTEQMLHIKQVS